MPGSSAPSFAGNHTERRVRNHVSFGGLATYFELAGRSTFTGACESLAYKNRHFGAPILLAPVASRVISDRHRLAVAERQYDSPQRNFVLLGEVLHNRSAARRWLRTRFEFSAPSADANPRTSITNPFSVFACVASWSSVALASADNTALPTLKLIVSVFFTS